MAHQHYDIPVLVSDHFSNSRACLIYGSLGALAGYLLAKYLYRDNVASEIVDEAKFVFRPVLEVDMTCLVKTLQDKMTSNSDSYMFDSMQQDASSVNSNSISDDWKAWKRPIVYEANVKHSLLSYPDIIDNTEGIAGVYDLEFRNGVKLIVDIGGGASDASKHWLENKYPGSQVFVLDPFARSREHNQLHESLIKDAGGAEYVTSISVLNVIDSQRGRLQHILNVKKCLKAKGTAYFKVWAGMWPERGSGKAVMDHKRGVYQANAWASAFLAEVEAVFGHGNAYADNNFNLIVAMKNNL